MKRSQRGETDFPLERDERGFSLVELIIVIAIMAVLVGTVGAQVIPYMERSREGKDLQIFSGWNTAGMSAYAMVADKVDGAEEYVVKITDGAVVCEDDSLDGAEELIKTFCDLSILPASGEDIISSRMTSAAGKKIQAVRIVLPAAEGGHNPITTYLYTDAGATTLSSEFETIENQ